MYESLNTGNICYAVMIKYQADSHTSSQENMSGRMDRVYLFVHLAHIF